MNVTDLRAALRERADTVIDHDAAQRIVQVRARVRVARRRRIAGVAALTVCALAVVSAVAAFPDPVAGPDRPAEPDRTPTAEPSDLAPLPTIQHEGFLSHSGEFDLVAAKMGAPGQNTLDLTIPAHSGEVHVAMVCSGVSGPSGVYWVSGYAGDSRPDRPNSYWCGRDLDGPVVPGVSGSPPGPWSYDDAGLTFGPSSEPLTVHLELTQEVDKDGVPLDRPDAIGDYVPVSHPDAVLGVGVYAVADPITTVAGTDIRPRVGLAGQDYLYQDNRTSKPGERSLTWTLRPSDEERFYDFVATDAVDPDKPQHGVEAVLDGSSCIYNVGGYRSFRAGGCLLSPGVPHTITLTIQGDPLANAELGIVLYARGG